MKKILITGCGGPAGVNFIKSLRQSKEKMYLVGSDINKYHLEWPDVDQSYIVPRFSDRTYINKLNELISIADIEMVHPQPDGDVKVQSANRDRIKARLFLPNHKTIESCQNKFKSARVWADHDIPVALTSLPIESLSDLQKIEKNIGYPYWLRATEGFSSRGSTLVTNINVAKHWLGYWSSREDIDWTFIAQEYLPGRIFAFQSLWRDGELITSQARERIEYLYPYLAPSGITNTPVVAVTVNRDDINDIATRCVLAIDESATGIFCVDLRESSNGVPYPTEINAGRFFTTSYFFTKAGNNMPHIYVKMAFDEDIPPMSKYNSLPAGLYWIRHIDAPAVLRKDGDWRSKHI